MFLTKNANGGKIPPHKKSQIIKGRGKITLTFSLLQEVIGMVRGTHPFSITRVFIAKPHALIGLSIGIQKKDVSHTRDYQRKRIQKQFLYLCGVSIDKA